MPLAAFAFGWLALAQNGRLAEKPARFDHLAERCSLLVIVTFGEMIVGITGYMEGSPDVLFAFLVFVFVVGLFLMYFFDYDYMLDHHREGSGVGFMLLTAWIVFVLGNITVSLEYLPEEGIDASVKGAYLASALCVYLASLLLLRRYNMPRFRSSGAVVLGRLLACALIGATSVLVESAPMVALACDAAIVWAVLGVEYALFRKQREKSAGLKGAEL